MGNPLHLYAARDQRRGHNLRRRSVAVPTEIPGTDAIFLVLRRMRAPLIVLLCIFTISTVGLSMMPGQDADGNPHRLTLFDAFYIMSYTGTTIGFGEIPFPFSYPQRMWITLAIYLSVVGWAYALSAMLTLFQDAGFQHAIQVQRLRQKVRALHEPFLIVVGYGLAGVQVCRALDDLGRRFVVIDDNKKRVDALAIDQFHVDVPGLAGDVDNPSLLGLAGLANPHCEGVLALATDEANLATVMAVQLLRPEIPVLARCDDRQTAGRMDDFNPMAVINPYDRYGSYLVLAIQRPATHQLATWLTDHEGTELNPRLQSLADGPWVVVGEGKFSSEVAADLTDAGLTVTLANPRDGNPDVSQAVGLVAGAESDIENLAFVAHARLEKPDIFLSIRQRSGLHAPTVNAFGADSLFVPSELVAREVVARIISPAYWGFIDFVLHREDEWSAATLDRMVDRFGRRTPASLAITLDTRDAPAVTRWLRAGHRLTLAQLLSDPQNRDEHPATMAVAVVRDGETHYLPEEDLELEIDDLLVIAGRPSALTLLDRTLYYDSTVEYSATGISVPDTWLWRTLARRRNARRGRTE